VNRTAMRHQLLGLLGVMIAWLPACSPEPAQPDPIVPFAGSYDATTLLTVHSGDTVDHLAQGAHFKLDLQSTGSAAVDLIVPEGAYDGTTLTQVFTSTWLATSFSGVSDTLTSVHIRAFFGAPSSVLFYLGFQWRGDSLRTSGYYCGFEAPSGVDQQCRILITLRRGL